MSITPQTSKKFIYQNLVGLINDSIMLRDMDRLLDVLEFVTSQFGLYINLRTRDITLVKLMSNGPFARLVILNKYGLQITVDLYPDQEGRYLEEIVVTYSLVNQIP
jgi:hypothetical protein